MPFKQAHSCAPLVTSRICVKQTQGDACEKFSHCNFMHVMSNAVCAVFVIRNNKVQYVTSHLFIILCFVVCSLSENVVFYIHISQTMCC